MVSSFDTDFQQVSLAEKFQSFTILLWNTNDLESVIVFNIIIQKSSLLYRDYIGETHLWP